MNRSMKLLDVVALLEDCPEKGLVRGQIGTIVAAYGQGEFEVEFSDPQGQMYALVVFRAKQLMVLHHQPIGKDAVAAR
jgi:Domain of unknown function (DUF4926)